MYEVHTAAVMNMLSAQVYHKTEDLISLVNVVETRPSVTEQVVHVQTTI